MKKLLKFTAPAWLFFLLFLAATLFPMTSRADSQTGAKIFNEKCSSCHSIGGGDMTGPDLKHEFSEPLDKIKQDISRMQEYTDTLSETEIDNLATLLKDANAETLITAAQQAETSLPPDPQAIKEGQNIFWGLKKLSAQGLACYACHQINGKGGNLGPDLSTVAQKIKGNSLTLAIKNSAFKTMRPIYDSHPITNDEANSLAQYLNNTSNSTMAGSSENNILPIAAGAAGIMVLFIALIFGRHRCCRRKNNKTVTHSCCCSKQE